MYSLQEMYDTLSLHLNRPDLVERRDRDVTLPELVHLLNRAQRFVALKLNIFFVRELETSDTNNALGSDGEFDLSSCDPKILGGDQGIIAVKLYDGKYCDRITRITRQEDEDGDKTYSVNEPKFFIEGVNIYIRPYADQTLDLVYKATPTDMALGAVTDTDCALNSEVQELINDYALGLGLKGVRPVEGINMCTEVGTAIYTMNSRHKPVTPVHLSATFRPKRKFNFLTGE